MNVRDLREYGEPFDPEYPEGTEYSGGPNYGPHDGSWPFLYHNPTQELIVGPYTWFHKDMLEYHPDPYMEHDYLTEIGKSRFGWGGRIRPGGNIDWYGKPRRPGWDGQTDQGEPDPDVIEHHLRQHLGLSNPGREEEEEDWTTSHIAAENPMEIVDLRQQDANHTQIPMYDWDTAKAMSNAPWFHSFDYPFLYHRDTNRLYMGPFGWSHLDMLRAFHPDGPIMGDRLGREYLEHYDNPGWGTGGRINPGGAAYFTNSGRPGSEAVTEPVLEQLKGLLGKAEVPEDEEEDWNVSHVAATSNLTIQELDTTDNSFDAVWGLRRPFILKDNVIHMGSPGTHHPSIAKAIGSDMYYQDNSYPGFIWTKPSPDAYEGWFGWHKEPPDPLSSDAKHLIAETYPNYVWGPGKGVLQPDYDWEEDWDTPENKSYGVLSNLKMSWQDTEEMNFYYQQVARKAEEYLAQGDRLQDAIHDAFGMVTTPPDHPDPSADPSPDEIAHVKSMMGRPNQPMPKVNEELEHIHKPGGRDSNWYNWRVPVNYYPDAGQVVTGDPGDFHGDLYLPHGGRSYTGMIGIQGRQGPQGEQYTPGFTWLDDKPSPAEHKAVINAISPHWPEAVNNFQKGEPQEEEEMDWGDLEVPMDTRWGDDSGLRLGFDQANGVNLIKTQYDEGSSEHLKERIPWIYHHPTGNLFMGRPGYFHRNIKLSPEYAQGVGGFPAPATEGWIWTNKDEYDHEEPFPDDRTKSNVVHAIQNYMGRPLEQTQPFTQEDWADLMEN